MLHVCRRSVRNGPERGGTGGDAAGYRLSSIPSGYEVRARFCWEFRTARRGFDSRRLQFPADASPGTYRIRHDGDWKSGRDGLIRPYTGYSREFTVN
jgi:Neutral/alkaline non-lysosomal ceramidase, C-terminal